MWNAKLLNALTMTFKRANLAQVAYCQSQATISQYVHIKGEGGTKSHGKDGPSNGSTNTHAMLFLAADTSMLSSAILQGRLNASKSRATLNCIVGNLFFFC